MTKQRSFNAKHVSCLIVVMLLNVLSFKANASITSLCVASGRDYQVSILQAGAVQYIDRNFTFTNINDLGDREYIQTANNDKYSTGSFFCSFTLTQPALVCVAHDDRITQKPAWLSQFTLTNKDLLSTDGHPLSIYTKYFEAGRVVLGGNLAVLSSTFMSMYSVVIVDQVRPTISDVHVANGRNYRISTVAICREQYVDRDYVFTRIGPLNGRQFIQSFYRDRFIVNDSFLSFTLDMAAVVYVAHDDRITTKPDWLLDFTDTKIDIQNSEGCHPMSVYQKVFPAGVVTLGGNIQSIRQNKFISMYTVIIGDAVESQTFSRTYNGDIGSAVQQTSDGGYIIGGITLEEDPVGFSKIYLIRTNPLGDTLWTKTFNEYPNDCAASDLQKTSDGGYIITGSKQSGSGEDRRSDVLLLKVDSSGNEVWRQTFGGEMNDYGNSVQQTFDGGYIIGGVTRSYGEGADDMYLIRTDESGNLLWAKTYGNSGDNYGYSALQTSDSGFIIIGNIMTVQSEPYDDIYVVKTDEYGDTEWTRTYGSATTQDIAPSIQKTMDGGYIIAGSGWNAGLFILKIDENGNELWLKILDERIDLHLQKAVQTSDGGYIAIASPDINMYKTDADGDIVWTKSYNGEGSANGNAIQQTIDGGYVVTGSTRPADTNEPEIYLLKTDGNGNVNQ